MRPKHHRYMYTLYEDRIKCDLYAYSMLLYSDETWTLYVESTKKLEALEIWIFKRLAKVSYKDRLTNEESLRRLVVERGLLSQIKTHKLTYFGHIART